MTPDGFGEPRRGAPVSGAHEDPGGLDARADPVSHADPAAPAGRPRKAGKREPGPLAVVRETVVLVVLAVVLAMLFKTFLVAAFYIPSGSMESTLDISDRVLVEKLSYRFGEPKDGDVIVFVHDEGIPASGPTNPVARLFTSLGQAIGVAPPSDRDFIKRVVGVPGDRIRCRDGRLYRNGRPVNESYLDPGTTTDDCGPLTVPPGKLYVMGDNRNNSQDSRVFGPIDRKDVVGRAFVRIWPLNHTGWLRRDR
jgi:signal peptidase I